MSEYLSDFEIDAGRLLGELKQKISDDPRSDRTWSRSIEADGILAVADRRCLDDPWEFRTYVQVTARDG